MNYLPRAIPEPKKLYTLMQSLAMLDAIICPDWEYRYFRFDAWLGEGESLATIGDPREDGCVIWFSPAGIVIRGIASDSEINSHLFAEQIKRTLPSGLAPFCYEPSFFPDSATFCYYYSYQHPHWDKVSLPSFNEHGKDGSVRLLKLFTDEPHDYVKWAKEFFECITFIGPVTAIYNHSALNKKLVHLINQDIAFEEIIPYAQGINYPYSMDD